MGLIETAAGMAVPQAALPLFVLNRARGAARWLFAHPMTGIALLAAVFGAVEHHEADRWAAIARQRGESIAAIRGANAQAIRQATSAKEARDAYDAKIAGQSDRTAADLRTRYHAAVLQLAQAQGRDRRPDLSGDPGAAASGAGPGEGSGVSAGSGSGGAGAGEGAGAILVSRDDALTCGDNTARLQAVHDWAAALAK